MNEKNCLAKILKVIMVLQENTQNICEGTSTCTRPFLGDIPNIQCFNTRLITFYKCDNSLLTLNYTLNNIQSTTTIFRIENVQDNTCTVLLIQDNNDGTYTSTNTYATINLKCICAIRCVGDINLTMV